jgi:hypothetical protein
VRQRARARRCNIHFARDLKTSPPEEWHEDIDQTLFPGGYFKEFIFFHRETRSLVVADTIINIELDKMDEPWRTATRLTGMAYPHGRTFFGMRLPLLFQRRAASAAAAKIRNWQPQRVLLSHGRCFESDAEEIILRILPRDGFERSLRKASRPSFLARAIGRLWPPPACLRAMRRRPKRSRRPRSRPTIGAKANTMMASPTERGGTRFA